VNPGLAVLWAYAAWSCHHRARRGPDLTGRSLPGARDFGIASDADLATAYLVHVGPNAQAFHDGPLGAARTSAVTAALLAADLTRAAQRKPFAPLSRRSLCGGGTESEDRYTAMSNLINQPLPPRDFIAMVNEHIERIEAHLGELRAAIRGYFAGVEHTVEIFRERDIED